MKIKIGAIILFLSILTWNMDSYAYGTQGRFESKYIYCTLDGSCTKTALLFGTAMNNWNSVTNVRFYQSASSTQVYVYECNVADDWDAYTYLTEYNGFISYAVVQVNSYDPRTWNSNDAIISVLAHELGHVGGLTDQQFQQKLMNGSTWGDYSRWETYRIKAPKTDDINGMNSLYY